MRARGTMPAKARKRATLHVDRRVSRRFFAPSARQAAARHGDVAERLAFGAAAASLGPKTRLAALARLLWPMSVPDESHPLADGEQRGARSLLRILRELQRTWARRSSLSTTRVGLARLRGRSTPAPAPPAVTELCATSCGSRPTPRTGRRSITHASTRPSSPTRPDMPAIRPGSSCSGTRKSPSAPANSTTWPRAASSPRRRPFHTPSAWGCGWRRYAAGLFSVAICWKPPGLCSANPATRARGLPSYRQTGPFSRTAAGAVPDGMGRLDRVPSRPEDQEPRRSLSGDGLAVAGDAARRIGRPRPSADREVLPQPGQVRRRPHRWRSARCRS